MAKQMQTGIIIFIMLFISSCSEKATFQLIDSQASESTKDLYQKISLTTRQGILVGHQDATAYGVGWKYEEGKTTSDIKMVCGDYPALYGWDIGHIENDSEHNLDTVNFGLMKQLIAEAHQRGGISTISWHLNNPVTGESSWSEKETIKYILEDEVNKAKFISWLDKVSVFLNSLKDEAGNPIPVIFRPFHEWTGGWFWWGAPHCTSEEFIELWKLTVETLRDKNNVHNVIYAFTSGSINNKEEFLSRYPGSDYADIIGFDTYMYNGNLEGYKKTMSENLLMFKEMAETENKLFAVTETGYEGIPSENWYSEVVFPLVKESGASWILFWRNYSTKHHYAPYPGHISAEDFKTFYNFPETLFENDYAEIKK